MQTEALFTSFMQLTGLPENVIPHIVAKYQPRVFKKKTMVLAAGKVANEVYFILSGCMRLYYEKEGKDISAYFFTEGSFAGAYDSFISRNPSRHYIEANEPCERRGHRSFHYAHPNFRLT